MRPGSTRDGVRMKKAGRGTGRRFDELTGRTGVDVSSDGAGHVRPPELAADVGEGLVVARMTGGRGVVELLKNALTDDVIVRYSDAVLEHEEASVGVVCQKLG